MSRISLQPVQSLITFDEQIKASCICYIVKFVLDLYPQRAPNVTRMSWSSTQVELRFPWQRSMPTHHVGQQQETIQAYSSTAFQTGSPKWGQDLCSREPLESSGSWFYQVALTEVKAHAQEHNEAKPGIEEHAEVDDANDDVNQRGDNVKYQVAGRGNQVTKKGLGAQSQQLYV